jgi:peptide-methionine (S)-S-oxide reductase
VKNLNGMMQFVLLGGLLGGLILGGCNQPGLHSQALNSSSGDYSKKDKMVTDTAVFGTGCFWCTEAVFQELDGVLKVTSGYSGGHVRNPTYEQVSSKTTGHAEVVQIIFDPEKILFPDLLEVFWKVHDPTTPNQQGNDIGPQYRSAIFYKDNEQKLLAEKYKHELDTSGAFDSPIVTEISPLKKFYEAEDYHQNFYIDNPNYGYCSAVIRPKLDKFEKVFHDKLRKKKLAK